MVRLLMKDDPALLECDRLIAMHIWSKIPAGYASLRYGPVMSAADTFDIYVKGKGGHGALPHQTVDPVVAASEFVLSMQRVVARELTRWRHLLSVSQHLIPERHQTLSRQRHTSGVPPEPLRRRPVISIRRLSSV